MLHEDLPHAKVVILPTSEFDYNFSNLQDLPESLIFPCVD